MRVQKLHDINVLNQLNLSTLDRVMIRAKFYEKTSELLIGPVRIDMLTKGLA